MSQDVRLKDYELLSLGKDPTPQEVRRAYHRMKALYSEGSLATYSLVTPEQRSEMLDNIERAYMRISREIESHTSCPDHPLSPEQAPPPEPITETETLGTYLKRCREDLGLTLRDVAARTRIRTTYLQHIEDERLSDLPAPVYLRGFVLEYARVLCLPEPEKIAAAYIALIKENGQ